MAKLADSLERWAHQPMRPGGGLHCDIFRAAIMMLEAHFTPEDVFTFLRRAADRVTDRVVPDREVHAAIRSAQDRMAGGALETQRWPAYEAALREEIIANSRITLEDLAASADALPQDPWHYVSKLYKSGEFVCLAPTSYNFFTVTRDAAEMNLANWKFEYINPSPMTDTFGLTKEKTASAHCLDNTGPKVYQVVEFDFGQINEHAAIHWWLARMAPLVMLVYSGGKSMHGWYNVRDMSEAEQANFFGQAVQLGADPKMWSRCQFSRLPAGLNNKTGKTQTVILFAPNHI